jgi:5-methylcytosine-specific restriction endonuclease McrA
MASKAASRDRLRRNRAKLFRAQKHRCYYCGCKMILAKGPADGRCHPKLATIDHIVPKSHGGTYQENSVAACHACNNERGDMDAREFLLMKMGLVDAA